jgi:hypothetical protein
MSLLIVFQYYQQGLCNDMNTFDARVVNLFGSSRLYSLLSSKDLIEVMKKSLSSAFFDSNVCIGMHALGISPFEITEIVNLIFDTFVEMFDPELVFTFLLVSKLWNKSAHQLIRILFFECELTKFELPGSSRYDLWRKRRLLLHYVEDDTLDNFFDGSDCFEKLFMDRDLRECTNLASLDLSCGMARSNFRLITDAGLEGLVSMRELDLESNTCISSRCMFLLCFPHSESHI